MNNEKEMIRKKVDFFLEEKIMAHIELRNKRFLNARIIEKKYDGVYIINERYLGLMHLFLDEVHNISEFVEVRE